MHFIDELPTHSIRQPGKTHEECEKVIRCAVYVPTITLALSNCIVSLRIWAIFQRKVWVLMALG